MFEELKEKIISQPVLSLPKREEKFRVETDASGHATVLWDALDINNFILFYFFLFYFYFYFILFYFSLKDDEEAHDNEVT